MDLLINPPLAEDQRPVLFLDVDGVLSPIPPTDEDLPAGWQMIPAQQTQMGFPLPISDAVAEALAQWQQLFQLCWATTWEDDANAVVSRLYQIEHLPTIYFKRRYPNALDALKDLSEDERDGLHAWPTAKLYAVAYHAANKPMCWAEDMLEEDAYIWADQRNAATLLIQPDKYQGLTAQHIAQITAFGQQFS